MNERINELASQCIDSRWTVTGPMFYREKFAELIVKKCLEQIDKIRDGCEDDSEYQQALGAAWAGLAVARHFGVEE